MFECKGEDLGEQGLDQRFPEIDYSTPKKIPLIESKLGLVNLLLEESSGRIEMKPFQKLEISVSVLDGDLLYKEVGDNIWEITVKFSPIASSPS